MTGPFWQRVAIQAAVAERTPAKDTIYTYETIDGLEDVEARITAAVTEQDGAETSVVEDAYEVHLRGAFPAIRPDMVVLDGSSVYDITRVIPPPPFGDPVTVLEAVVVAI